VPCDHEGCDFSGPITYRNVSHWQAVGWAGARRPAGECPGSGPTLHPSVTPFVNGDHLEISSKLAVGQASAALDGLKSVLQMTFEMISYCRALGGKPREGGHCLNSGTFAAAGCFTPSIARPWSCAGLQSAAGLDQGSSGMQAATSGWQGHRTARWSIRPSFAGCRLAANIALSPKAAD
jgi:hypothetical protein